MQQLPLAFKGPNVAKYLPTSSPPTPSPPPPSILTPFRGVVKTLEDIAAT